MSDEPRTVEIDEEEIAIFSTGTIVQLTDRPVRRRPKKLPFGFRAPEEKE